MTFYYQFFGRRNQRPDFLAKVRASGAAVRKLGHELAAPLRKVTSSAGRIVESATKSLDRLTYQISARFRALTERRNIAAESLRGFVVDHGLQRPVRNPDVFKTVMVTQGALLCEAVFASFLLISDGKTGIYEGIGYGLVFSFITIATGMVTGFFGCRWIGYRFHAPYSYPVDRLKRIAGWCGLGLGIGVIGTLGFAAARVRATGSHSGIFSFDEVSLSATFNDYFALALPVLAMLGATLAIYKGYSGIEDPYPGFQAAQEAAEAQIIEDAEELRDDLIETAATIRDDALDALDEDVDDIAATREEHQAGQAEYTSQAISHNASVEAARETARKWASEELARAVFVTNREDGSNTTDIFASGFDDSAFDAWLVPETPPGDPLDSDAPEVRDVGADRAAIETAHADAVATIGDAYAAFLAGPPPYPHEKKGA